MGSQHELGGLLNRLLRAQLFSAARNEKEM
jgi:hypothetical protein